ncbi:MAG: Rne/Rng family ribonuclease [Puniceicoccales bacterium]|jgi:ribonuclease G|nr:Rne/Rng family ribonuclease [Puniceicoccales bacterium]
MTDFKRKKQTEGIKLIPRKEKNCPKVDNVTLQEAAAVRAKDQSFFQKILNLFKKDKHYSEIIINSVLPEKRVAVLRDGILENLDVESKNTQHMVGAVFKGKIQNLEPGLKAAFVDVGQDKNAFLHYWDILPLVNGEGFNENDRDEGVEVIHRNTDTHKPKVSLQDIPQMFPIGSEIMIQITKSQIGTKGPRTTTNISLAGRYLVLTPYSNQCGISRKIEDAKERERLKKILKKLALPMGMGVIFRTASSGNSIKQFTRDLQFLLEVWQNIQSKANTSQNPCLLYHEPSLIERTVRDFLTEDVDRILIDNEQDHRLITDIVKKIAPNVQSKIVLFKEPIPIFDRFNIESQIEQVLSSRVPLPSGGEIIIQETEALTSIDVNTSSHRSIDNEAAHFIVQANIEAAREVARQVRLRNIGGLIIVDFIDMKHSKDRHFLHQFVQQEFAQDKAKVNVLPISALGVMQISRQRHKESFLSRLYFRCPYCNGEGTLRSMHHLAMRIQREIFSRISGIKNETTRKAFKVYTHPNLLQYIQCECKSEFDELEKTFDLTLQFFSDENVHLESYKIEK